MEEGKRISRFIVLTTFASKIARVSAVIPSYWSGNSTNPPPRRSTTAKQEQIPAQTAIGEKQLKTSNKNKPTNLKEKNGTRTGTRSTLNKLQLLGRLITSKVKV